MHLGMVLEPHYLLGGLLGGTPPLPYWHAKPDSPEGPKVLIVMLEVTWGN